MQKEDETINKSSTEKEPFQIYVMKDWASKRKNPNYHLFHRHADHHQFTIILRGELHCTLLKKSHTVSEGSALFLSKGTYHQFSTNGSCTYITILFLPQSLCFQCDQTDDLVFDQVPPFFTFDFFIHRPLFTMLSRLDHACYQAKLAVAFLFIQMLDYPAEAPVLSRHEYWFMAMVQYIEKNFMLEINLNEIAASASISPSTALRCFNEFAHTTPYRYLIEFRLHCAQKLLTTSDLPITEIMKRCGFNQPSRFGQAFKSLYKKTPRAYRDAHRIPQKRSSPSSI
ncbi:AraC family transcriptional regulator [uncultured Dubosiella sp.]|uniref:helix-turn-helix domain-containing protein n=4 Tax=uncultured Dubosiella sp. TaxID=1937011 RepID=UPI002597F1B3|nr:helix-turn-helix domain-containing protein [uncultured Dubosiella sp.]